MNTVERHIQYLAITTDCVIIPGWGGLIASSLPAHFEGDTFFPPRRSLVFNSALTHDDGILASSISRREGISFDAARAEISAAVASMRSAYESCGVVTLPRIGTFRRLSDMTMRFEADATGVAGARYAALPPVTFARHESAVQQPDYASEESKNVMPRESLARRVLRIAAFFAILLGLAITLSNPISVNFARKADFAGVGTFADSRSADLISEDPVTFTLMLQLPDSAKSVVPVSARPSVNNFDSDARYFLIIGSHDSRAKAERWIAKRPEKRLGIIERNGRYRVYAATGSTIEEASILKADPEFSHRNPDAWVYRRR